MLCLGFCVFCCIPGTSLSSEGTKLKGDNLYLLQIALMACSLEVEEDAIPSGICAQIASGKNEARVQHV